MSIWFLSYLTLYLRIYLDSGTEKDAHWNFIIIEFKRYQFLKIRRILKLLAIKQEKVGNTVARDHQDDRIVQDTIEFCASDDQVEVSVLEIFGHICDPPSWYLHVEDVQVVSSRVNRRLGHHFFCRCRDEHCLNAWFKYLSGSHRGPTCWISSSSAMTCFGAPQGTAEVGAQSRGWSIQQQDSCTTFGFPNVPLDIIFFCALLLMARRIACHISRSTSTHRQADPDWRVCWWSLAVKCSRQSRGTARQEQNWMDTAQKNLSSSSCRRIRQINGRVTCHTCCNWDIWDLSGFFLGNLCPSLSLR